MTSTNVFLQIENEARLMRLLRVPSGRPEFLGSNELALNVS